MAKHLSRKLFQQLSSSMATKNIICSSISTATDAKLSPTSSTSSLSASKCPFSRQTSTIADCPVMGETTATMTESFSKSDLLPYEAIPTPKGLPLIGTLFDLIKSGGAEYVHQYCDKRHQQLGPIYRETLGNVEGVWISDSALMQKVYQFEGKYPQHMVPEPWIIYNEINGIQRGLFFMDGPEWSERRRSLNKVFLKSSTVSEYADIFNSVVGDFLLNWDKLFDQNSSEANVKSLEKELYNWSIESLGTMIFGRRLGCVAINGDNETPIANIHEFVHCVQQIFVESANMQLMPPKLAYKLNLPVWRRFVDAAGKALSLARVYVNENVEEIKRQKSNQNCLPGQGIIRELLQEENIDQDEIVRIIVDLFIAAADTTSHATQWALYLLARNPQCQERLLEEVNRVTNGDIVEEKHLPELSYVKGVIKEALRLYPVAPFLSRYLSSDLNLSGYHIPAGKLIVMSLYTTGRKSNYFSFPDQFMPERWIRDKESAHHKVINSHACLPFGLGVRSCIGRRVAEIQMQFLLSRIVQKFRLSPTANKEIGIKLRMITTPEEPIHLKIQKRCN